MQGGQGGSDKAALWASGQLPSPVLCLLAAFHPPCLFVAQHVMAKTLNTATTAKIAGTIHLRTLLLSKDKFVENFMGYLASQYL